MAHTLRTASSALIVALMFSAPQVWAQSQDDALRQMAQSMASMSAAMQRLAQSPAAQPAAPTASTSPLEDRVRRLEQRADRTDIRVGDVEAASTALGRRVGSVERNLAALGGGQQASHPAQPATTARIRQASTAASAAAPHNGGVSATAGTDLRPAQALPTHRRLAVRFVGLIPNEADVKRIKDVIAGDKYEFETTPVLWLPAPGSTEQERDLARQGRDTNLDKAYGTGLDGRIPANQEELAQLLRDAASVPGTGAIVHLRLKGTPAPTARTP